MTEMMGSSIPVSLFSLSVPPGGALVPACFKLDPRLGSNAAVHITMAAIDPNEEPAMEEGAKELKNYRSTLKMIHDNEEDDDLEEDDDDDEDDEDGEALRDLQRLVSNGSDDDSNDDDDDEGSEDEEKPKVNGKSKNGGKNGVKKLTEALKGTADDSDESMADATKSAGSKTASKESQGDSDDDLDDSDEDDYEPSVTVLCTLDTDKFYQQPLDITIPVRQDAGFLVTGTHTVYLTGNIVMLGIDDDEDDDDFDYEPGVEDVDMESESDELDGQRITEVDTDEEEAPKLTSTSKKEAKKQLAQSKKRPADDDNLDDLIKADTASGKKQSKKLKTNQGNPAAKDENKSEKKVEFAKKLEQGPTGSGAKKAEQKENGKKSGDKNDRSITVIKGVTIDERTVGKGRKVKNGDKISVRYIGKTENGQVFDGMRHIQANKKGPPFTYKVGVGEVIKGWDIGMVGMAVGGERRLTIPPHLGYGSASVPKIPPNSTLIFDVKLVEIK